MCEFCEQKFNEHNSAFECVNVYTKDENGTRIRMTRYTDELVEKNE